MKLSYKRLTLNVPIALVRCLKRRMRYVRAAGGIVADDSGRLLLILRNGRWDLPKGKVEPGETLLQGALREVEEETGIQVLPLPAAPAPIKTYHLFNLYGGWHLKQTSWFRLAAAAPSLQGTPQLDEGITDVAWVKPDEARRRLQKSYGTLRILSRSL